MRNRKWKIDKHGMPLIFELEDARHSTPTLPEIPMNVAFNFGEAIRRHRRSLRETAKQYAKRFGIAHPYIYMMENGDRPRAAERFYSKLNLGVETTNRTNGHEGGKIE